MRSAPLYECVNVTTSMGQMADSSVMRSTEEVPRAQPKLRAYLKTQTCRMGAYAEKPVPAVPMDTVMEWRRRGSDGRQWAKQPSFEAQILYACLNAALSSQSSEPTHNTSGPVSTFTAVCAVPAQQRLQIASDRANRPLPHHDSDRL